MAYKFLKCKNPTVNHIKLAFGILLEEWKKYKYDCGYEFEGFFEMGHDVIPDHLPCFEDVDPKDDTRELPSIK